MTTSLLERTRAFLERFHGSQSGAVTLLLMAAFLILFMLALVMYDAGQAAQDKMDVQIAADSAAFSHSVIKARGMNMISYANTVKRLIFSFLATHVNAWIAIIVVWLYHASQCFKWFPNLSSCWTWAASIPMLLSEAIEAISTNWPQMDFLGFSEPRANEELKALDNYQKYIYAVTPWWAYMEGTTRAITNGAFISSSWPPPGSVVSEIKSFVASNFPSSLLDMLPSFTTTVERLPIVRRDGDGEGALQYCGEWAFSMEAVVLGLQVYLDSEQSDDPDGWKEAFIALQAAAAVGCFIADLTYGDIHNDYMIQKKFRSPNTSRPEWWAATSALHLAYHPHADRNADSGERMKFTYMEAEADWDREVYGNEGYFAMARSEIVFKQPFEVFEDFGNFVASIPVVGDMAEHRLGLHTAPDMWSPRWKAKNRPMILPGEGFGSAAQGPNATLQTVINDTIPFLTLGTILAVPLTFSQQSEPFSFTSAVHDLRYLYLRTSGGFDVPNLQGLAK